MNGQLGINTNNGLLSAIAHCRYCQKRKMVTNASLSLSIIKIHYNLKSTTLQFEKAISL